MSALPNLVSSRRRQPRSCHICGTSPQQRPLDDAGRPATITPPVIRKLACKLVVDSRDLFARRSCRANRPKNSRSGAIKAEVRSINSANTSSNVLESLTRCKEPAATSQNFTVVLSPTTVALRRGLPGLSPSGSVAPPPGRTMY